MSALPPQELVERALVLSKTDSCVVIADVVSSANVRWANNTLTTNGVTRADDLTVIAVDGDSVGVTSRTGVTLDTLEEVVRTAEQTARDGEPAEDRQPLVSAGEDPTKDRGSWDDPASETSIAVFESLAPTLGHEFGRAAAAKERLFGYAEHEIRSTFVATSAGARLRHDQPTGHLELNAKDADFSRSAWAGVPTADFSDVDLAGLTSELSRRLGWAARRVDLAPGRYETILPPSAVADLMIDLYWSSGARDVHDGRTVFSRPGGGTRVGERLTNVAVNLRSDPGDAAVRSSPFVVAHESGDAQSVFDNGLPLAPTSWIAAGELKALVQTRRSAELTGLPVTPYIDNLILDSAAGSGTLDEMVTRTTDRALLLTCLWYIREVDPQTLLLTGLTRDGVYLVERGEVVGAVNNFRFNESPVDLLGRITEMGASVRTLPREWTDYFTRTVMPPLRVAGFNMSTVSPAS